VNCTNQAYRTKSQGFTLIELMVATAIVGLLLSVALPAFQRYADRAKFSEAIVATNTLKAAVEVAVSRGLISSINDMYSGRNGIPNFEFGFLRGEAGMHFTGVISGSIYAMWPMDGSLLQGQTYILRADSISAPIRWVQGGSCMTEGYC
jgi:type IV pilus assembly protein PilA